MRSTLFVAIALLSSVALATTPPKSAPTKGALVLVIDRSGSMSGAKIDAAKTAAKAAISAMNPNDFVAVVAFNSDATVLVKAQRGTNRAAINAGIDRLQPGGGTNLFVGLKEAHEILRSIPASRKHVIVLSDGETPTDGISGLIAYMRKDNETISTVAIDGADDTLLKKISTEGGGRMYKVTDLETLSQVYVKELKEAKLAHK